MKKVFLCVFILAFFSLTEIYAQSTDEIKENDTIVNELKGLVLDLETNKALPYANIYNLHKGIGVISNEQGHFSIDLSDLLNTDTLRFQYIGYNTRYITIAELNTNSIVFLEEDIINLSETIVFGSIPDLESIVKNVLKYKDSNYKKSTSKKQIFKREREDVDINELTFDFKKSSIEELDRKTIAKVESKIPKHTISYTDFLGYLYTNKNPDDSVKLKIEPIRTVSLKEKNIAELEQLQTIFENLVSNTEDNEYWKIKSGVFGQKLEMDEEEEETTIDSISDFRKNLYYFGRKVNYQLRYSTLEDKDDWEFLHSTGKYKYTLAGGTRVNGEDVYIIDFEPDNSGMYIGRMYIGIQSYALIRADYEYAPDKTGTDFHLLGVGYTETHFNGSIFFEKKGDYYELKYFSYKNIANASIDRSLVLVKKRKRMLFDKKLKELKLGLNLAVKIDESIEYLILNSAKIPQKQFADYQQPQNMEIIYVDQFDDNLWKGFSIIEPTEQMKEYKKQEINYSE